MAVNIRQTAFALGRIQQSALGTANSAGDLIRPTKVNRQLSNLTLNTESNAEDIGKDDDFETQSFLSHWEAGGQLEMFLTSEMLAFALAFGLGNSTATTPAAGAFRHTAVPQSASIDLRPFSIVEKLAADGAHLDHVLIGQVVSGWTVQLNSGVGRQAAKLIIDYVGTGKRTTPSGITLPAATTLHALNAGSMTITINGTNYVTGGNIVSLECGFRNNTREDKYFPGSGTQDGAQIGGRMEHGNREAYLRFVARLRTSSDEFTKVAAQTAGTAVITAQGALITGATFHDMSVTFHQVVFRTAVVAENDGIATVQVECGVQKHATNGLMTAYATNEIALFGGET